MRVRRRGTITAMKAEPESGLAERKRDEAEYQKKGYFSARGCDGGASHAPARFGTC